jgi:hypothetical protein
MQRREVIYRTYQWKRRSDSGSFNVLFSDRNHKAGEKEIKQFFVVAGEIGGIFKKDRLSQPLWVVAGRN